MDSVLINVPVSSPLHPQANLPFLKAFLNNKGFDVKIFDTNIRFFKWMLEGSESDVKNGEYMESPVKLLNIYSDIEEVLYNKSKEFRNLQVGLRSIGLDYDRVDFASVLNAVEDPEANPFIVFYNEFVDKELVKLNPGIVGISITFQDQIIAAFTLASLVRNKIPRAKIVLGGQIITRCHDTMVESGILDSLWDYLVCWDGELPLLDIHNRVVKNSPEQMTNVISKGEMSNLSRSAHAFDLNEVSTPDFHDLDLDDYLLSEFLIPLQTARGCYGTCEFCAIPSGSNVRFRQRKVDRLVDDISKVQEHTLQKYGKKAVYFKFMDDTSAPKTLYELSREIENRRIEAQWETFVRLEKDFEDEEFTKQLYRGGCRKLMWGFESNDPDVLKNMNKKTSPVSTDKILNSAAKAGILNFVFVLVGFPGETDEQRERLVEYIIKNKDIHVLTIATFDVTKLSPIQKNLNGPNKWNIECEKPKGFDVRLPYTINGVNWKKNIVSSAQKMLYEIIKERADIGFISLFPDQVRGFLCNKYGNEWGRDFLADFGEENMKKLLLTTENYVAKYEDSDEMDFLSFLPEPLLREHARTKEDIKSIARSIAMRRQYEHRRIDQV